MQYMFVILLFNLCFLGLCYSFQALDFNKSPLQSQNLGMTQTVCVSPLPAKMSSLLPLLAQRAKVVVKHDNIMLLTFWAFCDPEYGSALERGLVLDEQDMGQTKVQIQ